MAAGPAAPHSRTVTATAPVPVRTRRPAEVADLEALRLRRKQALATVAAAPVRHLPAALLDALQGSWGSAGELGLLPERRLRLVAG